MKLPTLVGHGMSYIHEQDVFQDMFINNNKTHCILMNKIAKIALYSAFPNIYIIIIYVYI